MFIHKLVWKKLREKRPEKNKAFPRFGPNYQLCSGPFGIDNGNLVASVFKEPVHNNMK